MSEQLWSNSCGPRRVIPGKNYSFTVVVTNISAASFRRLKVSVSHYEPLTRASLPYRREAAANGDPLMHGAAWTLTNLEPGQSFRVSFTLPFEQHPDPKASNFEVAALVARGSGYSAVLLGGGGQEVVFIH